MKSRKTELDTVGKKGERNMEMPNIWWEPSWEDYEENADEPELMILDEDVPELPFE